MTVLVPEKTDVSVTEASLPNHGDLACFEPGLTGRTKLATSFLAVLTLALIGLQYGLTMVHPGFKDPRTQVLGTSRVTYLLEQDPRWKVLYRDKVCVLMERIS